jgi:hypothetical protein
MKYQEWQKKTGCVVVMTGYTEEKFRELLPYFKEAHDGTGSPPSVGRRSTAVEIQRKEEKTYGEERRNHQLLHGILYLCTISGLKTGRSLMIIN